MVKFHSQIRGPEEKKSGFEWEERTTTLSSLQGGGKTKLENRGRGGLSRGDLGAKGTGPECLQTESMHVRPAEI